MSEPAAESALAALYVTFARQVRDAQDLARRLGYLAANVEENIEDVSDFHAAVESLIAAAPVSGAARRLNATLTDEDRRLLRETRRARNTMVYDFFIDYPVESQDGTVNEAALARAAADLQRVAQTLGRARRLIARLEVELADED